MGHHGTPADILPVGEPVRAFYHANDHPQGYRMLRLIDGLDDAPANLVAGLSTGWMQATVAEEFDPSSPSDETRVLVKLCGRFADAYYPESVDGLYWRVPRKHVRRIGEKQPEKILSIAVIRWWDYWNAKQRNRARTYNVLNEGLLIDVLNGQASPHELLGEAGEYEVHTAFVRSSADLVALKEPLEKACSSGKHRAGLYFLWPTQRSSVEGRNHGTVIEASLFNLMKHLEAAGVRSCWPHSSSLYRQLCGKLWIERMSRDPKYRVPPTVALDYDSWKADPKKTASEMIEVLRRQEGRGQGKTQPAESFQGVVKLGFSWMGEDVRPFTGKTDLINVVNEFLAEAGSDVVCLVQERVENVACELRVVCFRDDAAGPGPVYRKELVRMRLHPPRHNDKTFKLTSAINMTVDEARDSAFCGSSAALAAAEAKALDLADMWLKWFPSEGLGVPASCRLDFLAQVKPGTKPQVELWTVELCECGGSLCGLSSAPRTAAVFNDCVKADKDSHSSRFPCKLPAISTGAGGNGASSNATANTKLATSTVAARGGGSSKKAFAVLAAVLALLLMLRGQLGRRLLRALLQRKS